MGEPLLANGNGNARQSQGIGRALDFPMRSGTEKASPRRLFRSDHDRLVFDGRCELLARFVIGNGPFGRLIDRLSG